MVWSPLLGGLGFQSQSTKPIPSIYHWLISTMLETFSKNLWTKGVIKDYSRAARTLILMIELRIIPNLGEMYSSQFTHCTLPWSTDFLGSCKGGRWQLAYNHPSGSIYRLYTKYILPSRGLYIAGFTPQLAKQPIQSIFLKPCRTEGNPLEEILQNPIEWVPFKSRVPGVFSVFVKRLINQHMLRACKIWIRLRRTPWGHPYRPPQKSHNFYTS